MNILWLKGGGTAKETCLGGAHLTLQKLMAGFLLEGGHYSSSSQPG